MITFLTILAAILVILTLVLAIRSDKAGQNKLLHWASALVAVLLVVGQDYEKRNNSADSDAKHEMQLKANKECSARLSSHLRFLEDKTRIDRDDTGNTNTTFIFQSEYPVVIRNAEVKITIDVPIMNALAKFPNQLPFKDNGSLVILPDRKTLVLKVKTIAAESSIELTIVSAGSAKIESYTLKPE